MSVGGGEGKAVLGEAVLDELMEGSSDCSSRRKDWRSASACSSRVRVRGVSAVFSDGEGGLWDGVWDGGKAGFVLFCCDPGAE